MHTRISKYWIYQIAGWGLFVLINLFFAIALGKFYQNFIPRLTIFVGLGLLISHLMRYSIIRSNALGKPVQQQLAILFVITMIAALVTGGLDSFLTWVFNFRNGTELYISETKILISNIFASFVYLFMWNCIYLLYHYIRKSHSLAKHNAPSL